MYLKCVEMQGFKSFAGKIKMEFHEGVTGIVGPNGSGKSNVADAVRWVLGEQSAKQLRGGNMQDVIFAGTQSRKPLGFASVAITLDNSDRGLNIDYDTVTVTRRLYRSGESEYLLNGSGCRLRDIQELFYDTGIGKEGYSIIGQGQIDRILSSKPEDRRELFDEAAGIVKFKRRKTASLKKLANEEQNLLRVTDILTELTRQLGPLEKQSAEARVYLDKRERLKNADIALFRINDSRSEELISGLEEKKTAAEDELSDVNTKTEEARQKYEEIDTRMKELDERIEEIRTAGNTLRLRGNDTANEIRLLEEQINSQAANRKVYESSIESSNEEKARRAAAREELVKEKDELEKELAKARAEEERTSSDYEAVLQKIQQETEKADANQTTLINLLNDRSSIKGKMQRYQALKEQITVRASELDSRMLRMGREKEEGEAETQRIRAALEELQQKEADANAALKETEAGLADIKRTLTETNASLDSYLSEYHRQKSLLDSIISLAESYEGYGNSVKRVLEQKAKNPGIHGVVAELVNVPGKYEIAIETALGGALQNIITDNETTAKYLIEFLKRGKYGRATFLPLTSVGKNSDKYDDLNEKGVLGVASDLVKCKDTYRGIIDSLLGRTYVVDNIDNAIAIGRKFRQKYRLVTLEGELINRGGAMTGGAGRHNANLLGRKRQIEELTKKTEESKKALDRQEEIITEAKQRRNVLRQNETELGETIQRLSIEKNTLTVRLKAAGEQAEAIEKDFAALVKEKEELGAQYREIKEFMENVDEELTGSEQQEKDMNDLIDAGHLKIEELNAEGDQAREAAEQARLTSANLSQKLDYAADSISTADREIRRIENDIAGIREKIASESDEAVKKEEKIVLLRKETEELAQKAAAAEEELQKASAGREELALRNKDFFSMREELSERRILLEKECYRLENALEKAVNERDRSISYLWEEYGMLPTEVPEDAGEGSSRSELLKETAALKGEIRALGSVNVNAIEEYKEVKERHEFLSAQYEDITKAAESLKEIISELDTSMRRQFAKEFENIRNEFNTVFKQLFGGGQGTLELIEDEDLLEAGVRIIAQPPGKKLQNMMQLSGGEKTLTAIALLFAIQNLKPSPFCLLDEIEAALDESNVDRFARYLHKLTEKIQFIIITHRRGTMASADRLYGITMQEKGVSAMVSVDLIEEQLN